MKIEPFSFIREGFQFSDYGYKTDISGSDLTSIIHDKITPIITGLDNYTPKINKLTLSMTDLSNNIDKYNSQQTYLLNHPQYAYSGNVLYPLPTIQDGIMDDKRELLNRENIIYLVSSIALSTLLIGAIIIGSSNN